MWKCGEIGRFRYIDMEEPLREPWWESEIWRWREGTECET